jgi:putative intracellular protease/amidase
MGVVYQAEHRLMGRTVALKVLGPELVNHPTAVERFRREVRAAARLAHPNIVAAYDADQAGDLHFLVMEFIAGVNLAALVEAGGPLPVPQACGCAVQAAQGLQHAFEQGMVHRDIKPQNLMLTPQGQVKILDFGLARLRREGREHGDALTRAGVVLGTPDYIAPEQTGDSQSVDIRADVYSLGCTLYFLLTGQVPFPQGSAVDKLLLHARGRPRRLAELRPDLPPGLVAVVERMMAKDPVRRYQTPGEVALILTPFARPPDPHAVPPRSRGRRTLAWGLAGLAVLVALLVLAGNWLGWWPLRPADTDPAGGATTLVANPPQEKPATGPPLKVVLLLPPRDFWYPDYAPLRRVLEQGGVRVLVTSSVSGKARHDARGGGDDAAVDLLMKDVRPEEFDALVLIGGLGVSEFLRDRSLGPQAGKLVAGMLGAGKRVAAVGMGTGPLVDTGLLADRRVVGHPVTRATAEKNGVRWVADEQERVIVDGPIVTARAPEDAAALAAVLLRQLRAADRK